MSSIEVDLYRWKKTVTPIMGGNALVPTSDDTTFVRDSVVLPFVPDCRFVCARLQQIATAKVTQAI